MGGTCKLCGGEQFTLLYPGTMTDLALGRFSQYALYADINRCNSCGLVWQTARHDQSEIFDYLRNEEYLDEDIGRLNLEEKHKSLSPLIRIIQDNCQIPGASILDIGANTGVFLDLAQSMGAKPFGLEPSAEAVRVAKSQFDLNIENAPVSEMSHPDEKFDIITLWDVVEHLTEPKEDLKTIIQKLKPNGYIFISTHDINSVFCRSLSRKNPLLMYQHFFHFSPSTIEILLEEAGFEFQDLNYYYKSWSFLYALHLFDKLWPGSLAARLANTMAKVVSRSNWLAAIRISLPIRLFFVAVARRPNSAAPV
jgi:2-polyprenyl-3-methyl-5-hydroxy-6-metoxy-1,4-benzoquinol methylase